ncbi:MAG: toxin-antitoxin system HicB family antitoxin [Microbacteriaceae bacterium]
MTWSAEDNAHIGTVAEFSSLSWIADKPQDAFNGILDLVEEVIADMLLQNETPPQPISERKFSGKFLVRIPSETHRQLALEAAEQEVSLNRLVASRLASF